MGGSRSGTSVGGICSSGGVCMRRAYIFKHLMAACLQSGHQLPLDSICLPPGASLSFWKAFALNGLDMPPACICLTQGNSFQEINLTQKNASAFGGILSPARLPPPLPRVFQPNILQTRNSENKKQSLILKRRKERQTRDLWLLTRKRKPTRREPETREAFQLKEIWFFLKTWKINILTDSILVFETKLNIQSSGWDVKYSFLFLFRLLIKTHYSVFHCHVKGIKNQ